MTQYRCYKEKDILDKLGKDFYMTYKEQDDIFARVFSECKDITNSKCYITNKKDIKTIIESKGYWSEVIIGFSSGRENIVLYSDKVKIGDESVGRILKNKFLSPYFYKQGEYILANKALDAWLVYNGISKKELSKISIDAEKEDVYFYYGLSEPIVEDGKYSGNYDTVMSLSETNITDIITNIRDVEVGLKVEKILTYFGKIKFANLCAE